MLLRRLFAHDIGVLDTDLAFRSRGTEVSRLEGFSDTVFGFAITLLVVSSRTPDSSAELLALRHAVLPFIASFIVLFIVWRAQFDFFRRYGLEDRRTIRLTGALLMIVLLAVYPVKFLFTFVLDVLPVAVLGGSDTLKTIMPMEHFPRVIMMYAVGFTLVSFVFSRLYAHAASQHAVLGLSELERFDTRVIERRCVGMAIGGMTLMVFSAALMATGGQSAAHRAVWWTRVYLLFIPVLVGVRLVRGRIRRHLAQERRVLADPATGGDLRERQPV